VTVKKVPVGRLVSSSAQLDKRIVLPMRNAGITMEV
jgi:hypothetical protein